MTTTTADGQVRVALTATLNPTVMQLDAKGIWRYVDADFWLGITPERFAEIKSLHWSLLRPAAPIPSPAAAPAPTSIEDLL